MNGRNLARGLDYRSIVIVAVLTLSALSVGNDLLEGVAEHRRALLIIGVGGAGWAVVMAVGYLTRWPGAVAPAATGTLVGASTACMLIVLAGLAALVVGIAQ